MLQSEFTLQDLSDREAIRVVLMRYATAIDTWNMEIFDEIFTPNVHAIFNLTELHGREDLKAYFTEKKYRGPLVVNDLVTLTHFTGNLTIDLKGDEANTETYLLALNTSDDGRMLFRCNRYLDKFIRQDRRWLIRDRQQITDWMTETPVKLNPDALVNKPKA